MVIENYKEFINQLTPAESGFLQTYAKNRVMEPFEGQAGLNTLQETNQKLSSGITKLKEWNKSRQDKKEPKPSIAVALKGTPVSPILDKLGKYASNFSNLTKSKYKELESVIKELMFDFLKKGLELTRNDDYEKWIIKSASKELNRQFESLDELKEIPEEDRTLLIESLYPYKSKRYKLLLASFDKSVSLFLGALVATNIPGTGILVSLVNMVKTIIRMSNRINSLSVIYGYKVENLSGLFEVCALVLNSIQNWDKNSSHTPLEPEIAKRLYQPAKGDFEHELGKFIEAVGVKEMYIAIPGIGMLSLGKINLDNLKIDLLIENIIQDFFLSQKINVSDNKDHLLNIINDYKIIYKELQTSDYLKVLRKKRNLDQKPSPGKNIGNFFKTMVGSETELDFLAAELASDARIIFQSVTGLSDKKKRLKIKDLVEELL